MRAPDAIGADIQTTCDAERAFFLAYPDRAHLFRDASVSEALVARAVTPATVFDVKLGHRWYALVAVLVRSPLICARFYIRAPRIDLATASEANVARMASWLAECTADRAKVEALPAIWATWA